MTIAVAAFVATFILVCAIAWTAGLFGQKNRHATPKAPAVASTQPSVQEQMLHTIQWLRRVIGAKPMTMRVSLNDQRAPSLGVKVALTIALVLIGGVVTLALIEVMLRLAGWTLFPVMDFIAMIAGSIFVRPGGAALLAMIVILIGVPISKRVRRPDRFRAGIALIALALVTFWPMQYFAATRVAPYPEYKTVLHGLALFISVTLFAAGIETLRRSFNKPEDDFWEV